MNKFSKIYVAGHSGLVGSAIVRKLISNGFNNIITRTREELDLLNQDSVFEFLHAEKPEYVFIAAAKVGGINANNTQIVDFLLDNLRIQNNIISSSFLCNVKKLLFLGSSCIYPRDCPQPIKEDYLLTGSLEKTNEWYALAKIAGIKLCEAYYKQHNALFVSAMPTNLYGPNDNYNLETSHVLPALLRKFHEAKINNLSNVICWGSGTPRREFLYSDDLATALLLIMNNYNKSEIINIGYGSDITIKELAEMVKRTVEYHGSISWDSQMPDGTKRKILNSDKIFKLGWRPKINLEAGLKSAYEDMLNTIY